ncbi:MAG: GNAT family N-acetyltransferase [Anaerolineales bacterium]|jgi:RimJ/RimL family protein N-acetyltransferase
MKILETKRLTLRQVALDDGEFVLELLNEPLFIQNIGDRGVRTLEDARNYISDRIISSYENLGFGMYLVTLKYTGAAAGLCGLVKRNGLNDVDIGYAFLSRYWSKGYATEAALAVKEHAKNTIGIKRLVAITDPANQGSVRVLEKIGLKFEKMIRLSEDDIELKLYGTNFLG